MSFARFFSRGIARLAEGRAEQKKNGRNCLAHASVWHLVFSLLLLASANFPMQSVAQGTTGSITGTVLDPSGAIVAGATVSVRNTDTNTSFSVNSSSNGSYTVTGLQPGMYVLSVEAPGFKVVQQSGIRLQINQVAEINPRLTVGSNTEQVVVTGGTEGRGWLHESASLNTIVGTPRSPAMNDPSPFGPIVWLCPSVEIAQRKNVMT